MNRVVASDPALILPLPRPEYPGGPEAFLTAVAWSAVGDPAFKDRGSSEDPRPRLPIGGHPRNANY